MSEESGHIAAFPAEVLDPSGAGDALTAAVAYGLLEGVSPEEAVRLGMAAAAQTVMCRRTFAPPLSPESLYERLVMSKHADGLHRAIKEVTSTLCEL